MTRTYLSLSSKGSTVPAKSSTLDKYTLDVVIMAMMVPMGIDFWGSAKSPDRLEPAIMPEKSRVILLLSDLSYFFAISIDKGFSQSLI